MSADIFISFASQDAKVARTICTALESRGFNCWISARNIQPGENFQSAIVRAIRGAKVLLLVFTANSNRSEEMTKELALASQQKLMVVPLRVENVDPSDAFAYEFATRQWIDLFSDWEQAMNNLCSRLTAALSDDRTNVDTIVLGKPSLREPPGVKFLTRAVSDKRMMAVGAAAVVLVAAGLAIFLSGGKPAAQAAAQPPASAPAPVVAPPAPAEPLVAELEGPKVIPVPEPVPVEAPKPKPKPKPKANLPY
jgi:hypothetical protein